MGRIKSHHYRESGNKAKVMPANQGRGPRKRAPKGKKKRWRRHAVTAEKGKGGSQQLQKELFNRRKTKSLR